MAGTEAVAETVVEGPGAPGGEEGLSTKGLWSVGATAYSVLERLVGAESKSPHRQDASKGSSAAESAGYALLTMAVMVGTALSVRRWIK